MSVQPLFQCVNSHQINPPIATKMVLHLSLTAVTKRCSWVDVAKGLGITLVLLGHLPLPPILVKEIHSFNMPCFFLFAGITFNMTSSYGAFIEKKWHQIIKPYLVFSLLSYAIWLIVKPFSHSMANVPPLNPLVAIFYGVNSDQFYMAHNVPLWFLPALFTTMLLFYPLTRLCRFKKAIMEIICLGVSYTLSQINAPRLPWSLDVALMAVFFMMVGAFVKPWLLLAKPASWLAITIALGLNIGFCFSNTIVDMNYNQYGNLAYFMISAISGIYGVINIAKY